MLSVRMMYEPTETYQVLLGLKYTDLYKIAQKWLINYPILN